VQALEFLLSLGWQLQTGSAHSMASDADPIRSVTIPSHPSPLFAIGVVSLRWRISRLPLKEMESKNGQQKGEPKMGRRNMDFCELC